MKKQWKTLWLMLLVMLPMALTAQPTVGSTSPDIQLPDMQGQQQSLHSLRGKYVLVDFWASWCGPCRISNRNLRPLYQKFRSKGFEIFGVSIDDKADAWQRAVVADKINWMQVHQAGGWRAPIARQWGIEAIPASFLINPEGRIIAIDPDEKQLKRFLQKNL